VLQKQKCITLIHARPMKTYSFGNNHIERFNHLDLSFCLYQRHIRTTKSFDSDTSNSVDVYIAELEHNIKKIFFFVIKEKKIKDIKIFAIFIN
jgi:hypothetical protein